MGHYCVACGKTRANEKFSGKGRKNHVCKDCSGKILKETRLSILDSDEFGLDDKELIGDEDYNSICYYEDYFEELTSEFEDDEVLPF
ncbi:MAG: hypothetical protein LCH34_06755 [Firmicutes bacterium]|nr:hypothetical protein [Bacillota bacterium]